MSIHKEVKKITINQIRNTKSKGEKLAMLTAYDFTMAKLIDQAGVDMILVGDSAANVMAGYQTTLPITLDQMIYHAQSVMNAVEHAFVVCDMPFGSYQGNRDEAYSNAVKLIKASGVEALKLEGGQEILPAIKLLVNAGIPVMGHLGLTPQHINSFGGYGLRAKEESEAQKLKEDSLALQEAGVFSIVLEKIPSILAKEVTEMLTIPTIGIGAGIHCDGQVLVGQDMLGMGSMFKPKFVRQFGNIGEAIQNAVSTYCNEVKNKTFPNENESY